MPSKRSKGAGGGRGGSGAGKTGAGLPSRRRQLASKPPRPVPPEARSRAADRVLRLRGEVPVRRRTLLVGAICLFLGGVLAGGAATALLGLDRFLSPIAIGPQIAAVEESEQEADQEPAQVAPTFAETESVAEASPVVEPQAPALPAEALQSETPPAESVEPVEAMVPEQVVEATAAADEAQSEAPVEARTETQVEAVEQATESEPTETLVEETSEPIQEADDTVEMAVEEPDASATPDTLAKPDPVAIAEQPQPDPIAEKVGDTAAVEPVEAPDEASVPEPLPANEAADVAVMRLAEAEDHRPLSGQASGEALPPAPPPAIATVDAAEAAEEQEVASSEPEPAKAEEAEPQAVEEAPEEGEAIDTAETAATLYQTPRVVTVLEEGVTLSELLPTKALPGPPPARPEPPKTAAAPDPAPVPDAPSLLVAEAPPSPVDPDPEPQPETEEAEQQIAMRSAVAVVPDAPTVPLEEEQMAALPAEPEIEVTVLPEQILAPAAGPAGTPAWQRFAALADDGAASAPMVALVIDDLGLNGPGTRRTIALPAPLTLAFMTYAPNLERVTAAARQRGHELIVHQPMEPIDDHENPGPKALLAGMDRDAIMERLTWGLSRFEGYVGLNNHMGSKFTSYGPGMAVVLAELRRRGLLFLDSMTSATTVGGATARKLDVPYVERDVFLDNKHEDVGSIWRQLKLLEQVARRQGYAVGIGHPHRATLDALERWIPEARAAGLRLAPISAVVRHRTRLVADEAGRAG